MKAVFALYKKVIQVSFENRRVYIYRLLAHKVIEVNEIAEKLSKKGVHLEHGAVSILLVPF